MIQDLEAEKAVLSGMYNHGKDAYIDVSTIVTSKTFSNQLHKCVFDCIVESFKQTDKIDYPIFLSSANKLGLSEYILKEDVKLEDIFSKKVELKNISILGKRIAKLHVGRQGQSLLRDSMSEMEEITGDESTTRILSILEKPGYEAQRILNSVEDENSLIGAGAVDLIKKLIATPNREIGISTGLPEYDRAIGGGIRRKGFALIGARRKIGKSALAANIAMFVAGKLKIPVLYLDTEMDAEQHQYRLSAHMTSIPITTIEKATFVNNKLFVNQLLNAAEQMEKLPITHKVVSGKSFDEILAIARRWAIKTVGYHESGRLNNCLVVYDYFKLMDPGDLKHLKEYEAIGYQATALSNFCIEMDLPCLAFVQLNRELDIAQSDRLSWLATSVCTFNEKTPDEVIEDGIEYGNRKIIFDVARFGEGLDKDNYINVDFNGALCQIKEVGTAFDMRREKEVGKGGFITDDDDTTHF